MLIEANNTKMKESASSSTYPAIKVSMRVDRKPSYWLLNAWAPLFIMVCCGIFTFSIPPHDTADRTAGTLTLMLTMVAYKFMIADRLPAISYT